MDRRLFFRNLVGKTVAVGAAVTTVSAEHNPIDIAASGWELKAITDGGWHPYKKWKLRWTGWKKNTQWIEYVGQWIACPDDTGRWYVASSFPGVVGIYHRGDHINTSMHTWQYDLVDQTPETSDSHSVACRECLKLLLTALDTGTVDYVSWGSNNEVFNKELEKVFHAGVRIAV